MTCQAHNSKHPQKLAGKYFVSNKMGLVELFGDLLTWKIDENWQRFAWQLFGCLFSFS